MAYNPPNLSQLRSNLARDLRDPTFAAFTTAELNDYINDGISELNELRPVETRLSITDISALDSLGLDYVWKVEAHDVTTNGQNTIPPNNDETNYPNGWQYYADNLILPPALVAWYTRAFAGDVPGIPEQSLEILVYGYALRDLLTIDAQVAPFESAIDEQAVRQYARWRGLDALLGDRRLFQQWQTQPNNSDVSPTQLTNMETIAESEWSRTRRRIYAIRRPAVGW